MKNACPVILFNNVYLSVFFEQLRSRLFIRGKVIKLPQYLQINTHDISDILKRFPVTTSRQEGQEIYEVLLYFSSYTQLGHSSLLSQLLIT